MESYSAFISRNLLCITVHLIYFKRCLLSYQDVLRRKFVNGRMKSPTRRERSEVTMKSIIVSQDKFNGIHYLFARLMSHMILTINKMLCASYWTDIHTITLFLMEETVVRRQTLFVKWRGFESHGNMGTWFVNTLAVWQYLYHDELLKLCGQRFTYKYGWYVEV